MSCYDNCIIRRLSCALAFAILAFLVACGNSNTTTGTTSQTGKTGWKHRIYLTNSFAGTTLIMNADNDQVFGRVISTIAGNNLLTESHDGNFTLSFSNGANIVYLIDNTIEDVNGTPISLPGSVESMGVLSNNTFAVTASRNAPVSGKPNGAVLVLDLTNRVISASISVPLVRRVALNHAGSKVLAFADNTNTAYVIDTTAATATPLADPNGVLDRPVNVVFSSDDSKAYILSCGAECGGTQAKVTVFNPADNSLGNSVNVAGATMGAIDTGGKLYVAGSTNGLGTLQSVDTAALVAGNATPSATVGISNGYHTQMAFTDNNRLYVGSISCSNATVNGVVQGCLTMYNTSAGTAVISTTAGDITGLQPIIGRSVAYVCQDGELVMYDTSADAPRPAAGQIDIVGFAAAVLQIS